MLPVSSDLRKTTEEQQFKVGRKQIVLLWTDPTFISVRKKSWLRFDGQTVNCLNICINPLLLYWEGFPLSTHFGNRPYLWPKIRTYIWPAFEIFHWHLCLWFSEIGLNEWQCNVCAAHCSTLSLLLQSDLSLLSVWDIFYMLHFA